MTKRTLIVALTVLMSTNMFAQQVALDKTQHKCVRPVAKLAPADTPVFGAQDAVTTGKKLSKETGLYYYKPDGSLYWNYLDEDNNVYATTNIFVPAWQDYTFINKADNPADTYWSVGGINYNTSYPSLIDENYNFTYGLEPGYGLPLPHLYNTAGTQSYVMGENTESYEEEYSVIAANNEILQLGFLDDKAVYGGFTSGDYIAGTGTVTDGEGTVWSTVNVCQRYPKPASPLYVENVAIIGVSDSGTPLKNGAKLTLEIYENNGENFYTDNVNYELNENHKLGELKETLTATMDDFTQLTYDSSTGQVQGQFTFTKKVEDPLFGEVEEPFVIDYPSTIVLSDFSDSNVDFGIEGYALEDCDDITGVLTDVRFNAVNNEGTVREFAWGSHLLAMDAVFTGMMDQIFVEDSLQVTHQNGTTEVLGDYNILRVSEDGKTCDSYGKEDDDWINIQALYVYTATEWFDEYGTENYSYTLDQTTNDDGEDWITAVEVEDHYDLEDGTFFNYVWFETEPLPDGVTGRSAILYLTGRGYTDSTPVVLIQGDAEVPDGINSVLAPVGTVKGKTIPATYNISGQRVGDNAKGIVIRDGKKYLNK